VFVDGILTTRCNACGVKSVFKIDVLPDGSPSQTALIVSMQRVGWRVEFPHDGLTEHYCPSCAALPTRERAWKEGAAES
jgi:hypothetical protein